jgi:hypothetical protein
MVARWHGGTPSKETTTRRSNLGEKSPSQQVLKQGRISTTTTAAAAATSYLVLQKLENKVGLDSI